MTKEKIDLRALTCFLCLCAAFILFLFAATEQTIISGGSITPQRMSLADLMGTETFQNRHIELVDFDFGTKYISNAEMIEFQDIYIPIFPANRIDDAKALRVVLWVRNDRTSNQQLIRNDDEFNKFVEEFRRKPRAIEGILKKASDQERKDIREEYPMTKTADLMILWARGYPSQSIVMQLWIGCVVSLVGSGIFLYLWRRKK